ncbi:MAG: ATP-binding protein [Brachymonas sp.]|nr:ATP-binding protein [Brachymonas sp.]
MDQPENPPTAPAADDDYTDATAADADTQSPRVHARWGLNLFWRTFVMMALLLTFSTLGWLFSVRSVDLEPRARQTAQQIASLVNLSRAALIYSDTITRYALIKTLAEEEGVRILPREPEDTIVPMRPGQMAERITQELRQRLGPDTIVARSVNGENGLWIGFDIDDDPYWLLTDQSRIHQVGGATWLVWVLMAGLLSLAGAAVMAGIINQPLRHLLDAISKVHKGDFKAGQLDEAVSTKEIREVNIGFNRMAEQMAKVEQERAVMLAGISHDLRTPLARLRLEVEMSVPDPESQRYMAADIEQLDVIINKFMDYARPEAIEPETVHLADVVQTCAYPYLNINDMVIKINVPHNLRVTADEVELGRVISNLMENARRYGKTPGTEVTELCVKAKAEGSKVLLQIHDRGSGVPEHQLADLTQPFFRADAARTSAVGSGLGLAIVKKVVEHMGGKLALSNRAQGGLLATLWLPRAR